MHYPNLPLLCDRLKWARTQAGKKQVEVARAVGIAAPTYSELEKGKYEQSRYTSQIALFLNVDSHWLATNVIGVNEPIKRDRIVNLHVANGPQLPNNQPDKTITSWLEVLESVRSMDRVVRFRYEGDSMTGQAGVNIPTGAVLVIDPTAERKPGRIAIADRNGFPVIGALSFIGSSTYLRPTNQQYPAIEIAADSIVGVVTLIEIQAP